MFSHIDRHAYGSSSNNTLLNDVCRKMPMQFSLFYYFFREIGLPRDIFSFVFLSVLPSMIFTWPYISVHASWSRREQTCFSALHFALSFEWAALSSSSIHNELKLGKSVIWNVCSLRGPSTRKKFQKMLILTFEANSALSCQNGLFSTF